MRFGVLGPLLCCADGTPAAPSAPKPRQLLALLLMNANRPVSAAYCLEELWGSAPPNSAASTLQTYVMQLRKALRAGEQLGHGMRLQTQDRRYVLRVEPGEFDVDEFEGKVRSARAALAASDDDAASVSLREALAVWRGSVFSDIAVGPALSMWAASLREVRLTVLEQRIEVDLRLGRHRELIGELSGMVQRSPLVESLSGYLMLALYRSGRQANALLVYDRLRRRLAAELGLAPTPTSQELQLKILNNDPELDPPAVSPSSRFSDELVAGRLRSSTAVCDQSLAAVSSDTTVAAMSSRSAVAL